MMLYDNKGRKVMIISPSHRHLVQVNQEPNLEHFK
jgi:hypothetical protein